MKERGKCFKKVLLAAITFMFVLAGVNAAAPVTRAEGEEAKWTLTVTDLYDDQVVPVSISEEDGNYSAVINDGIAYHEYQLTLRLNDSEEGVSIATSLSKSQYSSKWVISTEDNEDKNKVATLKLRSNGICVFNDSFDDFSFTLNVTSIDNDIILKSAVWHDVELEYQGGNKYGISTVLNESYLQHISADNGLYTIPFSDTVSDISHIVIWEYEKKSYTTVSGKTVEYYERVAKKDAPAVIGYDSTAKKISVNKINKDNPIAVMITEKLSVPTKEDNKYDCYWFYYYTDEYVKAHDNFTLDFYNYEKDADNGIITLESFNKGLSAYAKAALAIGSGSTLSYGSLDSIGDERYGNSKIPDSLTAEDFKLKNWNIPASYTDPYDGVTYKVALAANYEIYGDGNDNKFSKGLPLYPVSAENITVDSGVIFPDDCSYLFYESTTFGMSGAYEGASAHGWVGVESISNQGREGDYHKSTRGNTKSFKIVGNDMAGNVTNMSNMFRLCSASFGMSEFDISGINTSNVTDMSNMINVYLAYGDDFKGLSSINTTKVTNMKEMFKIRVNYQENPLNITASDLAGFNTSLVTDMEGMFADSDIRSLDLSGFTFNSVTTMKNMFYRDYRLEELKLPETANTSKVTDMSGLFKGCQSLTRIDNLNALDTENVTTMADMFGEYYFHYGKPYEPIEYFGPAMESIDLSGFNTKNVTDMSGMFWMPELKTLDISTFDTSKVTTMGKMFNLDSVTVLDVSGLNTENVTDMGNMFVLGSVEALDVSSLNVSKVTNMGDMFDLKKATKLILGDNFNTAKVTNVNRMFTLDSIKTLNVSLNLSSANSLSSLFNLANCKELTIAINGSENDSVSLDINAPKLVILDLSGSDANLTKALYTNGSYSGTFNNCTSLVDIYLPSTMPITYINGTPTLPTEFYLVGRDDGDAIFSDFSNITGDLTSYEIFKGGELVTDSRSDRPILEKEGAILLRVAETNPVSGVSIKVYKRDEDGIIISDEETGEYEYDDISVNDEGVKEITLYRYDNVADNYSSSILDGYPNYIQLFAITDPAKAYPSPIITWNVEETSDSQGTPVFTGIGYNSNKEFDIGAFNGTGSAIVTVTVEGYDKGNGSEIATYTDKVKVNVIPMIRPDRISFDSYRVEMKPGDTKDNPAKIWNSKHEGEEITFPGVIYESDKPEVVEVNATTGELTAKGIGTATITATSEDPNHIHATFTVNVTEVGEVQKEEVKINWLYLGADNILRPNWSEESDMVAIVGTTGTLDAMKAKGTISYDKAADTIVLNNYNELNLCVFKQGAVVLLKGSNKISGYYTPAIDGFCIDANCTLKAETGASLTVPKTAFEEHDNFVCTLDSSVTRTINTDGMIVFAGPAKADDSTGGSTGEMGTTPGGDTGSGGTTGGGTSGGSSTEDKAPAVGTTEDDNSGKATYKVSDTSTDSSGNTVIEVTYVAPTATEKKATSVTIPDTVTLEDGTKAEVTEIAANAFKKNTKIKKVTVGSNVETIGKNAFSGCTNLTTATIKGQSLEKVGDGAFQNCKKLTKVKLSNNVTTIGKNAFSGDKKLKEVTLNGNKIKKVGKNAFKGIKKNAKIIILAKNKTVYKKVVKMIKSSGAKNVKYVYKNKK